MKRREPIDPWMFLLWATLAVSAWSAAFLYWVVRPICEWLGI
jgi:hypothetical protein